MNDNKDLLMNIVNGQMAQFDVEYIEAIDNMITDLNALKDNCIPAVRELIETQVSWLDEMYHEWLNENVYSSKAFRKCYVMAKDLKNTPAVITIGDNTIILSKIHNNSHNVYRAIVDYYYSQTERNFEFDETDYNESLRMNKVWVPIEKYDGTQENEWDQIIETIEMDIDLEPLPDFVPTFDNILDECKDYDNTLIECSHGQIQYTLGTLQFNITQSDAIVNIEIDDAPFIDEEVLKPYEGDKIIKYNIHGKLRSGFASQWVEFMLQKFSFDQQYIDVVCNILEKACKQLEINYDNE